MQRSNAAVCMTQNRALTRALGRQRHQTASTGILGFRVLSGPLCTSPLVVQQAAPPCWRICPAQATSRSRLGFTLNPKPLRCAQGRPGEPADGGAAEGQLQRSLQRHRPKPCPHVRALLQPRCALLSAVKWERIRRTA